MSQLTMLVNHFKKAGSITQREALMSYSVQCLTKRIQELREKGFPIKTVNRVHAVTKQRYAQYVMN